MQRGRRHEDDEVAAQFSDSADVLYEDPRQTRKPRRGPVGDGNHYQKYWCDFHKYNTTHDTNNCKKLNAGRRNDDDGDDRRHHNYHHHHQGLPPKPSRPPGFGELQPAFEDPRSAQAQAQRQRPVPFEDPRSRSRWDVPPQSHAQYGTASPPMSSYQPSKVPFGAPTGPRGLDPRSSKLPPRPTGRHSSSPVTQRDHGDSNLTNLSNATDIRHAHNQPTSNLSNHLNYTDEQLTYCINIAATVLSARSSTTLTSACCWCSQPTPHHGPNCARGTHRNEALETIKKIAASTCPWCDTAAEVEAEMLVDHNGDVVMMDDMQHIDGAMWLLCVVRCAKGRRCGKRNMEFKLRVDDADVVEGGVFGGKAEVVRAEPPRSSAGSEVT